MFFKKGVLKKFPNFYRKMPVLEYLFNKVVNLEACNFIQKRLQHRCFPAKFAKSVRTRFFTEQLQWLLLSVQGTPRKNKNTDFSYYLFPLLWMEYGSLRPILLKVAVFV